MDNKMDNKTLIEILNDLRDDLWLKIEALLTDKETNVNSIKELVFHLETWQDFIIAYYLKVKTPPVICDKCCKTTGEQQ